MKPIDNIRGWTWSWAWGLGWTLDWAWTYQNYIDEGSDTETLTKKLT